MLSQYKEELHQWLAIGCFRFVCLFVILFVCFASYLRDSDRTFSDSFSEYSEWLGLGQAKPQNLG